MIKRLKLLWRLSLEIDKIRDYPNGRVEVRFKDTVTIMADDFICDIQNA